MKKLFALMLTLMLLAAVALPAMAEEAAPKYTITYDESLSVAIAVPDGYTVDESVISGTILMVMSPLAEGQPYFVTIIAPDEDRADVERLNDLDDEQLQALIDEFCADMNAPVVSFAETGMGTKLIVIDENDVDGADTAIVTLYKGYFLTTYIFPAGDAVTDAEKDMGIRFYTDMDFIY